MLDKIGKNIKKLFIVEEEEQAKASAENEGKNTTGNSPPTVETSVQSVSSTDIDKMMEHLSKIIADNNLQGFDYLEYRSAIKELVAGGQSEDVAFATVFTTAKTMGLNKENLVASANHYVTVLDNEKKDFSKEYKEKEKTGIIDKENQMNEIAKQIEDLSKEKSKLEREIQEARKKMSVADSSFQEAYKSIRKKIEEDVKKINKYIKE